jgi:hypothetical protein
MGESCQMFQLTLRSDNQKTGMMSVSTSPKWTCPTSCPFRSHGCYGSYGKTLMWWNRISKVQGEMESSYESFLERIRSLPSKRFIRHNQAGDFLPASGYQDRLSVSHALRLLEASSGKRIFAYTHYPVLSTKGVTEESVKSNRSVIEHLNGSGFAVNISCNSPAHVDEVLDSGLDFPVTTVLSRMLKSQKRPLNVTPAGRRILICPAVIKEGMTCRLCKVCMNSKRKVIIGFPAHGSGSRHCESVLQEWKNGRPNLKE